MDIDDRYNDEHHPKVKTIDGNITPIVHTTSTGIIYRGYAPKGTKTSEPKWKITKTESISDGSSGTIVIEKTINGSSDYSFVWDDRLNSSLQWSR